MTRPGTRGRKSRLAALGLATVTSVALLAATNGAPAAAEPKKPKEVKLQLLALNDFHGQLEPSTSNSSGRIDGIFAGGAEYLATHLDQLRADAAAEGAHSVTVAAGDLIGATPLISAAFHDEPTIEAMNEAGLDIASVGNHEFDEGWRELLRMQEGGCIDDGDGKDNQNSCPDGEFAGADFQYLAANVFHDDTGETVLPGVEVKEYDGVKVGFIGMTLENTPNIVTQAGIQGLTFTDEVETANAAVKELRRQGVKSIVVLLHEGGFPASNVTYNGCEEPGISGPVVDINAGLSPAIDVVITGHTHQAYKCVLPDPKGDPRLVTSAASIGRLVTDIDLTINGRSGEIDRAASIANNVIVTRDVAKDPEMTALIAKYKELVQPIASRVIGQVTGPITRTADPDGSGDSAAGNLIADSQKADASLLAGGPAPEIAFMNPGGIRTDLIPEGNDVTFGAAFAMQPFNNYDVAMDMTGAQILTLLEQQWSGVNTVAEPKILQVSGITYTWSQSAPGGSKVVPGSVEVNGEPLDVNRTYRVTANSFLSDGGDGFGVFKEATNKYIGGLDIDALAAYLDANSSPEAPYAPTALTRINVAP